MNRSILNRLKKLEKSLGIHQVRRRAIIIYDSDSIETFDTSQVDADCVVILPAKESSEGHIPNGSYQVRYI